jgi:predicted negative regulator of RcsB-dependent stress response
MTRLIEALRKAEEAKRKEKEATGKTQDFSLELEDRDTGPGVSQEEPESTPESPAPDLELSYEPALSEPSQPDTPEPGKEEPRKAVYEAIEEPVSDYQLEEDNQQQTVLDNRSAYDEPAADGAVGRRLTDRTNPQPNQPEVSKVRTKPARTRKKTLAWIAGIVLLLMGGVFAVLYWQLSNQSSPYANITPGSQRGFLESSTTADAGATPESQEDTAPDSQQSQPEPTQTTIGPTSEPPENPAQTEVDETISAVNALVSSASQEQAAAVADTTIISEQPTVFTIATPQRIAGSQDALNFARENIQQGEWEAARNELNAILRNQPNNLRALEYLAQVHIETGNMAQAKNTYARILQLDPQHLVAQAGLIRTSRTNSLDYEATLQSLHNSYPDQAFIPYMLGNLFARQQRWSEAAGSYQQAISLADSSQGIPSQYVYNLAVSLEHLREMDAALAEYRRAESLVKTGDNIDVAILNARIERLETSLEP